MRVYVQGASALAHYRTSSARTDVEQCSHSIRSLEGATSSRQAIIDAGIWRLGIGEPTVEQPLEVLVHSSSQRCRSKAIYARVWRGELAPTALRKVAKSIYVSSPEFVFLQMATRLDLPRLAALGMELCGTYRRNVVAFVTGTDRTTHITEYHQPPLTTPKRLKGFLTSMRSAPGATKAIKALEYVLPGSASPMETALYLLLCLPRRLGGYALPKPTLNPPIVLSKAGRRHTIRNRAKPDLYWKAKRLDLEYNSDEFHGESSRAIDSMRRKALERMRVEVIELTHDELYSTSLFHATALRIARRLGKRIRSEEEGGFRTRRAELRQCLLYDDISGRVEDVDASSSYDTSDVDVSFADDLVYESLENETYLLDDTIAWADEPFTDTWSTDTADFNEDWTAEILNSDDYWPLDQGEDTFWWLGEEDHPTYEARNQEGLDG